jgi:hypothetical protein
MRVKLKIRGKGKKIKTVSLKTEGCGTPSGVRATRLLELAREFFQ